MVIFYFLKHFYKTFYVAKYETQFTLKKNKKTLLTYREMSSVTGAIIFRKSKPVNIPQD